MAIAHELAGSYQHIEYHSLEAVLFLGIIVVGIYLAKKIIK